MEIKELLKKITRTTAVELADEFDRNFERKSFFNDSWTPTKHSNAKGSLLMRSGNLRRSIRYNVKADQITFSSSLPYASLHNEGGELEVTAKMKSFFWAMFYKADNAIMLKRDKDKNIVARNTEKNRKLTAEASKWKALALLPVGYRMKIEKRQFIGYHPQVTTLVEGIVDSHMNEYSESIMNLLKQK